MQYPNSLLLSITKIKCKYIYIIMLSKNAFIKTRKKSYTYEKIYQKIYPIEKILSLRIFRQDCKVSKNKSSRRCHHQSPRDKQNNLNIVQESSKIYLFIFFINSSISVFISVKLFSMLFYK